MKKIALIMALMLLVLSLAACSQKQNDLPKNDQTNNNTASTQESSASTETEGTTAATVKVCEHEFEKKVEQDATCEENGVFWLSCTKCGESVRDELPALGHQGSGASCEVPSFCIRCGELEEPAWGHDDQNGICRNCGLEMGVPQIPEETAETAQPQE